MRLLACISKGRTRMTVECGWDPAARPLPPKNVLPRCTLYLDFFFSFQVGVENKGENFKVRFTSLQPPSRLQGNFKNAASRPSLHSHPLGIQDTRGTCGIPSCQSASLLVWWSGSQKLSTPSEAALLQSRVCPWFVGKAAVLARRVIHSFTGPTRMLRAS